MSQPLKVFTLWKDPMFDEIFIFEKEHVSDIVFKQLEKEKVVVHTINAYTASEARQKVFGKRERILVSTSLPKLRIN